MKFTEKLDELMKRQNITRGGLSEQTGIPYNTIVGFYTKGYSNIKMSNLKKLSVFFNVPMDVLADDDCDFYRYDRKKDENSITEKYSGLSQKGKDLVKKMIDGLLDLEAPEEPKKIMYIREYVTPAAAGYASPAEDEDYILVERTDEVPAAADFAVRIDGDSMEPYIKDGSRVYVSRTNELSSGDIGIFFVDGDMKCKQYCEDSFGNIYLFSLNRKRADADMTILSSSGITVFCFGKVLTGRKIALPISIG